MRWLPRLGVRIHNARSGALFRRCGIDRRRIVCEGKLPVVHCEGSTQVGSLRVRGAIAPAEIGAFAGGRLTIGENVFINQGAIVVAALSVSIGDNCRIGDFAAIYDSDYHEVDQTTPVRRGPVSLGQNVWLGRGAVILPGVSVGDHAVIAAGSVVTKDVPARTLVAGNPARTIRQLQAADGWRRR